MPPKSKSKLKLLQLNIEPAGRIAEPEHQPTSCRENAGHGKSLATTVRHDSAVDVLALAAVNHEGDQSVPSCVLHSDERCADFSETTTKSSDDTFTHRLGTVYIGSVKAFWNTAWLKSNHVTHVLNCAGKLDKAFGPRQQEAMERAVHAGMKVMTLPWRDHCFMDIQPLLPTALRFISQARRTGGGCLVHCAAGRSRSATVVIAYDMLLRGCSVSDSVSRMLKRHKTTQPNPGFLEQLHEISGWPEESIALAAASAESAAQTGFGAASLKPLPAASHAHEAKEQSSPARTDSSASDSDDDDDVCDAVPVSADAVFAVAPAAPSLSQEQLDAKLRWQQLAAELAQLENASDSAAFLSSPVPDSVQLYTPRSTRERFEAAGWAAHSAAGSSTGQAAVQATA